MPRAAQTCEELPGNAHARVAAHGAAKQSRRGSQLERREASTRRALARHRLKCRCRPKTCAQPACAWPAMHAPQRVRCARGARTSAVAFAGRDCCCCCCCSFARRPRREKECLDSHRCTLPHMAGRAERLPPCEGPAGPNRARARRGAAFPNSRERSCHLNDSQPPPFLPSLAVPACLPFGRPLTFLREAWNSSTSSTSARAVGAVMLRPPATPTWPRRARSSPAAATARLPGGGGVASLAVRRLKTSHSSLRVTAAPCAASYLCD